MKIGRPRKYETAEELWEAFEGYIKEQRGHTREVYDKKKSTVLKIEYDKPLTVSGFCLFAGISRECFNNYKNDINNLDLSDTIKKIYMAIETEMVEKAVTFEQHASFTQFILGNAHGERGYNNSVGITGDLNIQVVSGIPKPESKSEENAAAEETTEKNTAPAVGSIPDPEEDED